MTGYPNVLQVDPISVNDFCGGCGRAHARCKSYTEVTFSGSKYDKRTLVSGQARLRADVYEYSTTGRQRQEGQGIVADPRAE